MELKFVGRHEHYNELGNQRIFQLVVDCVEEADDFG